MLVASQLFWVRRILDLGERFIPGKPRRDWVAVITGAVYLFIKWGPAGFEDAISRLVVLYAARVGQGWSVFPQFISASSFIGA